MISGSLRIQVHYRVTMVFGTYTRFGATGPELRVNAKPPWSPCTVLHYHIIRWALYLVRIIKSHHLYVHQLINKTSSLNFRQRPQSTQNSLRRETHRKISGAGDYDLQNASRSTKASALDATLFEDKRCFSFRSLHYTERRSHVILSRSVLS